MELKQEEVEKVKETHKDDVDFEEYLEKEVVEIAKGVANYYLTLFKIYQRIKKNGNNIGYPLPSG